MKNILDKDGKILPNPSPTRSGSVTDSEKAKENDTIKIVSISRALDHTSATEIETRPNVISRLNSRNVNRATFFVITRGVLSEIEKRRTSHVLLITSGIIRQD